MFIVKNISVGVIVVVWLTVISWFTYEMLAFQYTPGKMGKAFEQFPKASRLILSEKMPTVIMFLHPKCSCSKASLAEMKMAKASIQKKFKLIVVLKNASFQGEDNFENFKKDLNNLPNTSLIGDSDSYESNLFEVKTSGQIYIYSSGKKLLYFGGNTPSRGISSASKSRDIIAEVIEANHKNVGQTIKEFIYGCEMDEKS